MSFRSGTGSFLRAHRVKNSRASSNRLTTINRNFHICFLKRVQGTDPWIKKVFEFFVGSFTEDHPLSSPAVVFGKSKQREIWSILSAISQTATAQYFTRAIAYRKVQRTKKNLTEIFRELTKLMARVDLCSLF